MNKINEGLLKAYDNIIEQQKKMDNKAYIFIGLLTFAFSFINKDWNTINVNSWFLVIIVVPLLLSLLPIANEFQIKLLNILFHGKRTEKPNIFYYLDIYALEENQFAELFKKEYEETNISKYDEKIIEQILTNAKILKTKVMWHNMSTYLSILSMLIYIGIRLL